MWFEVDAARRRGRNRVPRGGPVGPDEPGRFGGACATGPGEELPQPVRGVGAAADVSVTHDEDSRGRGHIGEPAGSVLAPPRMEEAIWQMANDPRPAPQHGVGGV